MSFTPSREVRLASVNQSLGDVVLGREVLELFSSKVSVDQDLSVIVAETINDDDVKQRLVPIVFTRA